MCGIKAHSFYSYWVFFQIAFSKLFQHTSYQRRCASFLVVTPKLHKYLWCYQFCFYLLLFLLLIIYILEAFSGLTVACDLITSRRVQTRTECCLQTLGWYLPCTRPWSVVLWEAHKQSLFGLLLFSPKGRDSPMEHTALFSRGFLCYLLLWGLNTYDIYVEHSSHLSWNVCSSILIPARQQSITVLPSITIFQ